MTELPDRVHSAFRDHSSFEKRPDGAYESVTTPFNGVVTPIPAENGRIQFEITVSVPMLNQVTEDEVAPIVEEGWYETFELRVVDIYGVTKKEHNLEPIVEEDGVDATVSASFTDINERRGVDDAGAVIDYVEGTYVQGIIPGYEYTDPVTQLISRARNAAGAE